MLYIYNVTLTEYNTDTAYMLAICYAKVEYYTKAMEILDLIIKKDPYEYYRATSAKSRLTELKDDYNATHRKSVSKNSNSSQNTNGDYGEETENAPF